MIDRVVRDRSVPPCDSLAEAVVLQGMLLEPARIAECSDLIDLLVAGEHRQIWRAMQDTYMRTGPCSGPEFTVAWLRTMEALCGDSAHAYAMLVLRVEDDLSTRAWAEYERDRERNPDAVLCRADYSHPFGWWLDRLKRVAEARRGIQAAQEVAERYWRVLEHPYSVQEAYRSLERHIGPRQAAAIRIDV